MTEPLPCGCGAAPIFKQCRGQRSWLIRCPVPGCDQTATIYRRTVENCVKRWNEERTGTEKKYVSHPDVLDRSEVPRCKCGLTLPCESCLPSIEYFAQLREDRGPASGRIRLP